MTKTLTPLEANNKFEVWFNRTNDIITLIDTEVVTANSTGASTTGDGYVVGTFGADVIVAGELRGGDLSVSNTLIVTSNVQFNSGVSIYTEKFLNVNAVTSGTSAQLVDSFPIDTYRGGEYVVTIKSTVSNKFQISKLLLLYDGVSTFLTEYGIVVSNGSVGVFAANADATDVRLYLTPTVSATTVHGTKILTSNT